MLKILINMADRSAVMLSTICVIHCVLLPIILVLLPTLTSVAFFNDELFHSWLLFFVLPISAFAVVAGYFHHRSVFVVTVTSIGISILVLVAILGHDIFGEKGEVIASVLGSLLVAYGHIKNFKIRKKLNQCRQMPFKSTS